MNCCSHNRILKLLNEGKTYEECYKLWKVCLANAIDYFYYNIEHGEEAPYKNPSRIKSIDSLVKNILCTHELFNDHIKNICDDRNLSHSLSKIIACDLFACNTNIKNDLIALLNLINWDCNAIFQHAEIWTTDESQAGYDMVKIMEIANKYYGKITGYDKTNVVYALLMAVYHCNNDDAEKFIIEHFVKLTPELRESDDGMIGDMVDYFKNIGYDLISQ